MSDKLFRVFPNDPIPSYVDYAKGIYIYTKEGEKILDMDPIKYAKEIEALGAGELIVNFIDRDGTRLGYDIDFITKVYNEINIPESSKFVIDLPGYIFSFVTINDNGLIHVKRGEMAFTTFTGMEFVLGEIFKL